jgi:NitT/TauT family transport system substrate-binding protein
MMFGITNPRVKKIYSAVLSAALAGSLLVALAPASQAATARAGQTCPKVGAIGVAANGNTLSCKGKKGAAKWKGYKAATLVFGAASAAFAPKEEFAVFAVPKQLGYFKSEKLTVSAVTTGGSIDAVNLVGQGRIDIAGADLGSALQGIQRGVNIKIIGGLVQNFPWLMATDPKKNIKSPADLRGKTIGIIGFGSGSYPYTKAWLAGNNMKETDVKLVAVGGSIGPATVALERGDVDAIAFFTAAYAGTEFAGTKYNYLPNPAALTGVRSLSWVVNADRYAKEPEVFERFLRASFKGLTYSTQNPTSGARLGFTEIPAALAGQPLESRLALGAYQLKVWLDSATPTTGTPVSWKVLGDISLSDWSKSQAYTRDAGTTVAAISRAKYFDSRLLGRANDFDRRPIVAAADKAGK